MSNPMRSTLSDMGSVLGVLHPLFMPHANHRLGSLSDNGLRFSHYTTASTALKILVSKRLWLRNASVMNDYMEIAHGSRLLVTALKGPLGRRLFDALPLGKEVVADVIGAFADDVDEQTRTDTYLLSLAEHDPAESQGRLSMWRAYGGDRAGVALVFNIAFLEEDLTSSGFVISPVLYADQVAFDREMLRVVEGVEREADYIRAAPRNLVFGTMMSALRFAALSTKHLGFAEEAEWRIVSDSTLAQGGARSRGTMLREEVVDVGGIPQIIRSIDLGSHQNDPDDPLHLNNLLDQVIVGPCAYPQTVITAFRKVLAESGAHKVRVIHSDIPLRQKV